MHANVIFFPDRAEKASKENTDVLVQGVPNNVSIDDDDDDSDDDTSTDNEDEEIPTDKEAVMSVQSAANCDSEDCDTMECMHGHDAISCTICHRPTGRYGREFKKKQDDDRRRRQRKKGRIKDILKRVSFR